MIDNNCWPAVLSDVLGQRTPLPSGGVRKGSGFVCVWLCKGEPRQSPVMGSFDAADAFGRELQPSPDMIERENLSLIPYHVIEEEEVHGATR